MSAKSIDLDRLQREWYDRLKDEGFDDIESCQGDRPLKKWSFLYEVTQHIQPAREDAISSCPDPKFSKEEELLNLDDFLVICQNLCTHGNRHLTGSDVKSIWIYYCEGTTHREIAKKVNTTKRTVFRIICELKEWMKVV